MGSIVALGESHGLEGFVLVGVDVRSASTPTEVCDAWDHLGGDVGLVILSPRAASSLGDRLAGRPDVLTAVLP